jgi:hypothetical protein
VSVEAVDLRADYHGHVTDYACDLDRARFAAHPFAAFYTRSAVDHEWCPPGGCAPAATAAVRIIRLADGVRLRFPIRGRP